MSDNFAEEEVIQGELTAIEINPKMYHDIQVILSRLVAKAEQLLDNVTTNLAESYMHVRTKYDGGKSLTAHSLVHGSTIAWMQACSTTWARSGDLWLGSR